MNTNHSTMQLPRKDAPHIGNMIKKYVKEKRLFQSGWARQQGVTPKAIAHYLKNPSMRTDTLFTICQVLNYNFFRQIADTLPATMPPETQHESRQLAEELKQEVAQLKLQVATLEKALGLVGGR